MRLNKLFANEKIAEKIFRSFKSTPLNVLFMTSMTYLPVFPLYTDGGIFSIYAGTDGFHSEYYENCIFNLFSLKDPKPFYLVDYRDVNTLSAIYYNMSALEFYTRLLNYEFPGSEPKCLIDSYKQEYKKFFNVYDKTSNIQETDFIFKKAKKNFNFIGDFTEFNYLLFIFHNNLGYLYNDRGIYLEDEYENLFENNPYTNEISAYRSLYPDTESFNEFLESKTLAEFNKNNLHFILKKIKLISLKKGVKFIIYLSEDEDFLTKKNCKENMKCLYNDYKDLLFNFFSNADIIKDSNTSNSQKSSASAKYKFDPKDLPYSNKLKFKDLPEIEYGFDYEKIKSTKNLILKKTENPAIKVLEFNLSAEYFKNKPLKPLVYIEIMENSDFYELDFNQYFIARFLNVQEIRGISPYTHNIKNINYEEPIDKMIDQGLWVETWNLNTIPKIIPFGSLLDLEK